MQYEDMFRSVLTAFPTAAVISTCGHISRDLFNFQDRDGNFYLVGSMGMAAPVGVGVALADPGRPVVVLDGDGSLAMNTGGMLSVGATGARLLHVALDNGVHGSTGGQRTVPFEDPVAAALAFGYRRALSVDTPDVDWASIDAFPAFVHAKVRPRSVPVGRRVVHTPDELRERFARFLSVT
ncbi:thiamine pyrophosphate-dependent enzyme [Streptomyces sp. NPDC088196]|uniref:thiamine pyrophosphate-dependent enzyme n=1 Tax=Streptomyces sp. NPDC088196 TaxID=3154868 RepID=UPI00344CC1A0